MPVLITFIPMLMGTSGNSGSQSSTMVIRGLAVGEIQFKDFFRVVFKEIRVALIVGVLLAIVNGIRVYLMYDQDLTLAIAIGITMIAIVCMLAIAIGITMIAIVCMAKCVGCTLPLLAKKIGLDPALMAAPLISTIMDTCTILMYFAIITALYRM